MALDTVWCWGYPLVFIILYYVVQPARYMIFGITGCISAYDRSWPSIVLSFMWAPITTFVAACYASVLSYRLYLYRCEFARLVAARNTTKSRFIRLFVICLIVILIYLPYSIYLLVVLSRAIDEPYSWSRVHDPDHFNLILKVPAEGTVTVDKWAQVVTGYILFFVFGTGSDAHNTYRKMLLAIGLGRCSPCLYAVRNSGSATPNSFIGAKSWRSSISSKAKSMFDSRSSSMAETTVGGTTRNGSVVMDSLPRIDPTSSEEVIFAQQEGYQKSSMRPPFTWTVDRQAIPHTVLPFSTQHSHFMGEMMNWNPSRSTTLDNSPGESAKVWVTDTRGRRASDGVRIFHDVQLESQDEDELLKETKSLRG